MALFENVQNFFRDNLAIMAVRNVDYSNPETTGDEYFNFVGTAFIHRVSPQQVISQMITMKAIRLAILADGKAPKGESVADTLRDLANYAAIYRSFEIDDVAVDTPPLPNPTPDDIDVHPAHENKESNEAPTLSAEVKSALLRLLSR